MSNKILIAYASRCGSTGEVAQAIADELSATGLDVDVLRVQDVRSLSEYQAVIIGSAARMGKLLPEARRFGRKFRKALQKTSTAYFTTGVIMVEDTPENRAQAEGYLESLCQIKKPISKGLFAGKVDHNKLGAFFRMTMSSITEGIMANGDHRDWESIRGWAKELAPQLA